MSEPQVLEGTWEEIRPKAEEIGRRSGRRRLKMIVMDEDQEGIQAKPDLPQSTLTAQERIRLLDELAERNRGLPVLPPEAFERESIYEDVA